MKKVLHRSFKPAKCKTALQMASSRLKILKNKKDIQIKQLRKELAQLLESGQTQTARIRVEHAVREEKTVAAYELVGLYCELLVARLAVIESQKNCPTDLKEAVASVLYASQRLADVPEFAEVVKQFSAKYGKDFASAAVDLRPDSGVSRLLVEKLSVKAPDGPTKVKILTEIAKGHNVEWEAKSFMEPDPKDAEVLRGPSSFEPGSSKHADYPRVPAKETPNFQAPPAVNVQHGSSERNNAPASSYKHDGRSSTHANSFSSHDNLGKTPDSYHPNARPSGDVTHAGEYRHPNPGDGNSSPRNRQKWDMEFADATSAARAAAESAERASIAARAAAELSSKERTMKQNSMGSQSSHSSFNNRNEHLRRGSSSNVQSEGLPSPRRNVMHYESAHAAAESAERESTAARAAAERSSKERMMRQNSTEPQNSHSYHNNRSEHPRRSSSSHVQREGRHSPRRNVMHYEEMGSAKQDNFSGEKSPMCSDDELSEISQGRRGTHSRQNSEMRQPDSFAKSGSVKQPSEPDPDLDVGYSDEVQLRKQSSRASSHAHSRTFSGDHVVASDYIKSPPSVEENIFASDDKYQSPSSPEETYHHDSSHAAAAFDEYDSFFDKPQFDKEVTYSDEPDYGLESSLLGGKTSPFESTDAWSSAGDYDKSGGKLRSSSQVFQEKPTSPVFDDDSTGPVITLHEPERSAKFDDYGADSESEVDEPSKKDGISGGKHVEESLNSTSCSCVKFQDPDEVGHDFFPSDKDEPMSDSGTREESDSEIQMGLRFDALTGGLKNKKTLPLPPYTTSPARDTTLSKPEKENTKTKADQSLPSSPPVSSRSSRSELYTEEARNTEKKPISAPPDPSSSDDDSETELPGRTSLRQEEDRRTKRQTRASYVQPRTRDDDSEELPRRASIRNQERTDKQTTGARDHKRPTAKTQASTFNLSPPFSEDENENEAREELPRTNAKPTTIGLSRRTKGQGKAPEKSSSLAATRVTTKTGKESYVQQSQTKSEVKQQPPLSASSSLPKVKTSAETGSSDVLSADTPSKERASHVHPKLPDYEDLLTKLGALRANRK